MIEFKVMTMEQENLEKKLIREVVGLGADTQIILNEIGWTSRVYLVNSGEVVFKFPRSEKVKEEYRREIPAFKLAHRLKSEVQIPEVRWEHPNYNYLGYKGIVGSSLDEKILSLTNSEKKRLGSRIGAFLRQLHHSQLPDVPLMSIEQETLHFKQKFSSSLDAISKEFTKSEVDKLKELVCEEFPRLMGRLGFTKGLCHGDLGYWNIVYGSAGEVGIIDFGDVAYYDTSIDFAGMNDEILLDAALHSYGTEVSKEKINLRKKIIPVLDLPFFIESGNDESIEKKIAQIRRSL